MKQLSLTFILAVINHKADGLTCYVCAYTTNANCLGEKADIYSLGTQTDNQACHYCYKKNWETSGRGERGCVTATTLDTLVTLDYSYDKLLDNCTSVGDTDETICVCSTNRCNSSPNIRPSFVIFMLPVVFLLMCTKYSD